MYLTPNPNPNQVRTSELWGRHHAACNQSSLNALMLALPFWWRLMQCLRVYSETREQKNLWRATWHQSASPAPSSESGEAPGRSASRARGARLRLAAALEPCGASCGRRRVLRPRRLRCTVDAAQRTFTWCVVRGGAVIVPAPDLPPASRAAWPYHLADSIPAHGPLALAVALKFAGDTVSLHRV